MPTNSYKFRQSLINLLVFVSQMFVSKSHYRWELCKHYAKRQNLGRLMLLSLPFF